MTRKESLERKNAMLHDLRDAHRHCVASPDDMIVSQRLLCAKYGLSARTVSLEMQKLVDEGVLYTVPRVGTFVGRPKTARDRLFLAVFPYLNETNGQWSAVRDGFEERIANLGGTSMALDFKTASQWHESGELTVPSGVFEFRDDPSPSIWLEQGIPRVEFGELNTDVPNSDAVYFNNVDGGWKATRHLLALGHQKIAFLGLHGAVGDYGFYLWSKSREMGWRKALDEAGLSAEGLLFQPQSTPGLELDYVHILSREIATDFLTQKDITAVITVNALVTQGLLAMLLATNIPMRDWPAIVGFDTPIKQSEGDIMCAITALRLPWEEIGREAANLLWERAYGRLDKYEQRLVPMTLIPRLSCRREWHRMPPLNMSQNPLASIV